MRYYLQGIAVTATCLALSAPGFADQPATAPADTKRPAIATWKVPWENTRPRDPYVDGQGRVWFVGQRGDYLAHLHPGTGEMERIDLSDGVGPHNLIIDSQDAVWYAGNRDAHIGRLDPETGEIDKIAMPDERARDPHTLIFDHNEDIWFTVQHGNMIGKLSRGTGAVELAEVPTPRARPYGIVVDPANQPWAVLLGTNKLATVGVTDDGLRVREVELPREDARPRRLAATEDGRIWYVDFAGGYLGVYDQLSGDITEWLSPSGTGSRPYAMAAQQNVGGGYTIWYVESGPSPHLLVSFDPQAETFTSKTEIEHSTGSTRHMIHHNGELWFGLDSDYIARAVLP